MIKQKVRYGRTRKFQIWRMTWRQFQHTTVHECRDLYYFFLILPDMYSCVTAVLEYAKFGRPARAARPNQKCVIRVSHRGPWTGMVLHTGQALASFDFVRSSSNGFKPGYFSTPQAILVRHFWFFPGLVFTTVITAVCQV